MKDITQKNLWDVDHPYYCAENNFFSNDYVTEYESWDDFYSSEGHADQDMNCVFRWDWDTYNPADDDEEGDIENTLKLFYMLQRKGIFRIVLVKVQREDEPKIKEWLKLQYEYMQKLWEPFS